MTSPRKKRTMDEQKEYDKRIMHARAMIKELYKLNPVVAEDARKLVGGEGDTLRIRKMLEWAKEQEKRRKKEKTRR